MPPFGWIIISIALLGVSAFLFFQINNQELPIWYHINLCPIRNPSSVKENQLGIWKPISYAGRNAPLEGACPAIFTEESRSQTLIFHIPTQYFTSGLKYYPVVFRTDFTFVSVDLIELYYTKTGVILELKDLYFGEKISLEEGEIIQEVDEPLPQGYTSMRKLMKGVGRIGSYSYVSNGRVRWGSGSMFGNIQPNRTDFGWTANTVVPAGTLVQIFHNGPPLSASGNCVDVEGCQYILKTSMSRDELQHGFIVTSGDDQTLELRLESVWVQQTDENGELIPFDLEPEVFITFITKEVRYWYEFLLCVFAGITMLVYGCWKIYMGKDVVSLARKSWRMPFPQPHGNYGSERTFYSTNGNLTNTNVVIPDTSQITHLDLSWNNITVITNMDRFTRLQRLDLSNNDLESLQGLGDFSYLRWLDISGNWLKTLQGMNNMPCLEWMNASNNNLEDLSTLKATKLKDLNVSSNHLVDLTIQLPTLKWLDASNNDIKRTELDKCSNLTHLDLSSNFLTTVTDLEKCQQLEYINLANNDFTTADSIIHLIRRLPNLKLLDISRNALSKSLIAQIRNEVRSNDRATKIVA